MHAAPGADHEGQVMVEPRTMPGVLELLPPEQIRFQEMLDTIRRVYERFGFVPIETPGVELAEVLLTKSGGETERQVYFVQSTGSLEQGAPPELAMPFDLTVPFARYVAEHEHELTFPFRRYQIQRVYRGESPQRGRFREFYQCDVDVVDRDQLSLRHDGEMPVVIAAVFDELAVGEFTVALNNRKLMRGLLAGLGVGAESEQQAVLREVDKLDRRGEEAVGRSLDRLGLDPEQIDRLLGSVRTRTSSHEEALEALRRLGGGNELLEVGRSELETVLETVRLSGVPERRYALDLSIARGLDYYTGTVYETILDDHPGIGSVCSGGRYDDLAGYYTSSRLPGVGVSIGFTRLFSQLRERGLAGASASVAQVYVTLMDEDGVEASMGIASALRRSGLNTLAAAEPDRLGRQLRHADRLGIPFVVIAGPEERARGEAAVKDLAGQTQEEVPVERLAAHIHSKLGTGS